MIEQSDWEWFGDPGHFICAQWCRFHLCTKVGRYIISTVGAYVHPRHSKGSESTDSDWLRRNWPGADIGLGRKYETMVFEAGERCDSGECGCRMPTITGEELACDGYNKPGEAATGHLKMCLKYAQEEEQTRAKSNEASHEKAD